MKKSILLAGPLQKAEQAILEQHFDVVRFKSGIDPDALLKRHQNDIVGIISDANFTISERLVDFLPNLEIIAQFGVGYNNIDLDVTKQRGIVATNTPDVLTSDVADLALGLTLAVARRMIEKDMFVRLGKWGSGHAPGLGTRLKGKTFGIVGLGRIGREVARRAEAFGLDVVYYDIAENSKVPYPYYSDLHEMAAASHFLVLCCTANDETDGMIDIDVLEALGKKGFLINVSRGRVVNESDLIMALYNKTIAGAGLDVYINEPHVPEELYTMDNVVILPHISSSTVETYAEMGQICVNNLIAHFEGKKVINVL